VFDSGRLAAREAQAQARVVALEQQYLRTVFTAFGEVEEALNKDQTLRSRHAAIERAKANAQVAEELAFEQYRRGLIDFGTVLEAQRRAFDSETQSIGLRAERLRNLVSLHEALGGAPLGV
jgi:outer membrane protein TolC